MLTHQNAPDQQKAKAVPLLLKLKLWASSGSMLVVQWYWYTVVYLQRISLNSVNRRRVQSMLYNRSAGHSYLCCWWLISQPWKIKLIRNIQMKTSVKNTKGVHCSHSLYCSHCIFDVSWFLFFLASRVPAELRTTQRHIHCGWKLLSMEILMQMDTLAGQYFNPNCDVF